VTDELVDSLQEVQIRLRLHIESALARKEGECSQVQVSDEVTGRL